jgi:hypothetical protein
MNRLFLIALIIGVVWYAWRSAGRRSKRVVEALKEAESKLDKNAPMTLEKDPKTGVYRPAERAD